ncbi:MAG: hypothetical protein AAF478_03635 [Pseudomonadota bacterium]
MDTARAFALGDANRGNEMKVFDWDKAARLIKERTPLEARAGLQSDWEYTGGPIYRDGSPVPSDQTYVYLASTWATPEIDLDGDVIPCFKMESETNNWDADTYWPDTALEILTNEESA